MRKEIRLKETEIVFMLLNVKRKFDAKFEIGRVMLIAIEISNGAIGDRAVARKDK